MLDRRERWVDEEEGMRAMLDGFRASLWTALPCVVESFDAVKMTVTLQPTIKAQISRVDGRIDAVTMPLLLDVPVIFPTGGGFTLTFPVQPGDEALAVFASRCIDSWWQSGGVQEQAELRTHSLSDAFAILGPRSQPRVLPAISTSTVQLRSDDGSTFVEITAGQVANIVAPGGINLTTSGKITLTASEIDVSGPLISDSEGTFNGHTVGQHTHSDPQGGTVGLPTG